MTLSIREREVLEVVASCTAIGSHVLAEHFEDRMPEDELELVLSALQNRQLITINQDVRHFVIRIAGTGRQALAEVDRG